MAVTITSNLTTITAFDATAGVLVINSATPAIYSGFNREGTNCIGEQASQEVVYLYSTFTAANYSNRTIIGPWLRSGNPGPEATGGFQILLGDGVDRIGYHVGGSDNYGFFYNGWSLFKLDCANPPATFTTLAGSEVDLNFANIVDIGGGLEYLTKAAGTADNVFIDVARWVTNGTPALVVGGGTTGDRGTFGQVVAQDESTTNAYGIIRTIIAGSKAYELNFGIDIGNAASASSYFEDSDFQLFISGGISSAGNMDVAFLTNATGTNLLSLNNFSVINTGTVSNWDLSSANSNTLSITSGQFVNCGTIAFPVAGGTLRQCLNTIFTNCGQVTPSTCNFTGNIFNGTTDVNGAMLLPSSLTNMSDLTFNSDGTGHAIYITTPGTYTFTNFNYSGYGANDTTNAVIYNNSGGAVTVNVDGGNSPTYRNGAGATTTIVAGTVTVSITATTTNGTPVEAARVLVYATAGGPFPSGATVTITNSGTTATVTHTAHGLATNDKIWIRGASLWQNNGVFDITVTGVNSYTYTMPEAPGTNPTGTILATFAILFGSTNASGVISMSRVFPSNQPINGRVRKSSAADNPKYKTSPIAGTVSSTTGFSTTAVMIIDQ